MNLTIRKGTHLQQLSLEDIDLVEEQDDRCPQEKLRVDHALEEHETLSHAVLIEL